MTSVSALVCTRDRPQSLLRTIRSLLSDDNAAFDLFVIDQSDGFETQEVLASGADSRLHYVRSKVRGKGAALNEGLRLARGAIIVCTDDDCEAAPGWVMEMAGALEKRPASAILFCNVLAGPHDQTAGYVPGFTRYQDRSLSSILAARHGLGLGAGMAFRRDVVLSFGGFDETFGPGSRFPSGDDWDVALRLLLFGWQVFESAQLSIVHHGFRTFVEGREHALRDWRAIGAVCAKPIRAGYPSGMVLSLWLFSTLALWPPLRDLLAFRPPAGRSRLVGFIRGFAEGLGTPVDPQTLSYRADIPADRATS
jgi:glycosyltransferase involved in cell wall biosynthesis